MQRQLTTSVKILWNVSAVWQVMESTQLLTRSGAIISRGHFASCGAVETGGYGFQNTVQGKGGSIPLDFIRLQLWNIWPNGRSAAFYLISAMRKKQANWFS